MIPGVSIVIPTWNGLDLLKRFLPSVASAATHYGNQSDAPTEILIVDDGSDDGTIDWLIAGGFRERRAARPLPRPVATPALRFVRNQTNRGFGEACNRGFEAASFPLVLLLNNDVDLAEDAIAPLVENFKDAELFAAHCRVIELESGQECGSGKLGAFARGFIRVHRSYACLRETNQKQSDINPARGSKLYSMFAGGGSAMFDRDKFLSLGAFEPLLSPFYWEDVELSHRAWKRGYTVVYEPRSVAHHRISSTIRKLDRRRVRRIQQRNRLIYHWIHLHDGRMLASHVLWVALLALTAPLRLQPGFISSCAAALKSLPQIRARRGEEKRRAKRSDREVFEIFSALEQRGDVFVYDDLKDLRRLKGGEKVVKA
ncbi:MAG TPA: glycosyltransferase [Blastocatellia bacterium]|nr:glycosyltransferase [Blastocatellia bacterium]